MRDAHVQHGLADHALRWALPRGYGGDELGPIELHLRYEQLARRSLEDALILTQRDSAVGMIASATNQTTRDRLLAEVRDGAFVTVGIAQLTTSRQHRPPAVVAERADGGWRINGRVPWATAARMARYVVIGAAVAGGDAEQILVALPTAAPGVAVGPPIDLTAMAGTMTSEITCDGVDVNDSMVLLGPAKNVLALRRKSVPVPQAFLALGHCRAALDLITAHRSDRARALAERFGSQIESLHARVLEACTVAPGSVDGNDDVPLLRGRCNLLAVRIAHAAVALYKGAALMTNHPAQRLAREAMFLLVWSCPEAVIDRTTDLLASPT